MQLTVQLIGTPQFQLDHVPITPGRRVVAALLAYLTVRDLEHSGQRHSRESLAALLWTEYQQAKALTNLRHTLWEVTQFIGEGWILAEHETIFLNPKSDLILDVAQFRSLLGQALQQADPALRIPLLIRASNLYRADFLSGFSLKEGSGFNDWAVTEAESIRRDFASTLRMLADDYTRLNQASSAVPHAQRLIALDPLSEAAHRQLMQLYALTDQQNAAIHQYQALEKLLRKELNLDPQPETRELYKKIRRGEFKPVSAEPIIPVPKKTAKHNLPVQLTSFIGREKERDQVARLVRQNRLVTLIGAGGIGKTRLSLQVGQYILNDYPDGAWFVPLESLTDQDGVPQTVASFLKIAELPDQDMLETLVNELSSKALLIILDNCEHLLDACAQLVETVLKNCPHVNVLATSREVLGVEGEASYHVPSLALPHNQDIQILNDLPKYEAIQLFTQRARLVQPSFEITDVNLASVIKICNRLDGIPLAIELAAAHVDIFTLEEILSQLRHSFDLLTSKTRSTLPRHQTMQASIDWGWSLLTESERTFMRRLSVFLGGWTLPAAQFMDIGKSQELTSTLAKKSFVVVLQRTAHGTRYGFHEVVRSYAIQKLIESGEERTIRDRQLQYFLELARQFEPALHGVDQDLWLERLWEERDNIHTALEWAARSNVQAGLYLSHRLRAFWENYDRREEARWLLMI